MPKTIRTGAKDARLVAIARHLRMFRPVVFAAATLAFAGLSTPGAAQRSMAEGFGRMQLQAAPGSNGYERIQMSDGTVAERFILRPGDCPRSTGDCQSDRERIEFFDSGSRTQPGDTVWYAYSVYLPADFPIPAARPRDASLTLGQIHQRGRSGPELLMLYDSTGLAAMLSNPYELDDDPMNPLGPYRYSTILPARSMLGRFTRIMIHAKWSRQDDGYLEVFVNGSRVWSYSGATTNANEPLYFKYGLYRSFVSRCGGPCPELWAIYRDVRRGYSRAAVE
jgi:hypothetical protein